MTFFVYLYMEKNKLNINAIKSLLSKKGLSQSDLATQVGVSKQVVSAWLKGDKLPSPLNLLRMSTILEFNISDIFISESDSTYNFKLPKNRKETFLDKEYANDMSKCLAEFEKVNIKDLFVSTPFKLISPKTNYRYLINAGKEIRNRITQSASTITIEEIINFINKQLNVLIVPVLWGKDKYFADGLQISFDAYSFLFVNLNSKKDDMKFWLLHEIAHLVAQDLEKDQQEEFANHLAQHILFPEEQVIDFIKLIDTIPSEQLQLELIKEKADQLGIHPYTVFKQIKAYSEQNDLPCTIEDRKIYSHINNTTEFFIDNSINLEIRDYINYSENKFKTLFFKLLQDLIKSDDQYNAHFISRMMHIPFSDAVELYMFLSNDSPRE